MRLCKLAAYQEDKKLVTIEYECETDFDLGLDCPALAKIVAEKVLDMEKCPWDAQVNLVLTDNEEIKRVNTEFRGIERATDVLLRHRQTILWQKTMNPVLIWTVESCFLEIL